MTTNIKATKMYLVSRENGRTLSISKTRVGTGYYNPDTVYIIDGNDVERLANQIADVLFKRWKGSAFPIGVWRSDAVAILADFGIKAKK